MDDIERCGNDVKFIGWWLNHHGKDFGDFRFIAELSAVLQGTVQVLASTQIRNEALAREFRAESAKSLTAAAAKLASASLNAVAV